MCHLLLLLPFISLPIFWLAPLSVAGPAYAVVLVVSGGVYYLAVKAMHRPVVTGVEALLHASGIVVDKQDGVLHVKIHNEIWKARAEEQLGVGDVVTIESVEGLTLKVRPMA